MKDNFKTALGWVLQSEGSYVDNPKDPGGATNKGITLATFRRVKPDATVADLRDISDEDAGKIYKSDYWDAAGCPLLSSGVDYTVFDTAVNQGVTAAHRMLDAIKKHGKLTPEQSIPMLCDWRRARYKTLAEEHPKDKEFLQGWLNRVAFVEKNALFLAKESAETLPVCEACRIG